MVCHSQTSPPSVNLVHRLLELFVTVRPTNPVLCLYGKPLGTFRRPEDIQDPLGE